MIQNDEQLKAAQQAIFNLEKILLEARKVHSEKEYRSSKRRAKDKISLQCMEIGFLRLSPGDYESGNVDIGIKNGFHRLTPFKH